MRLSFISLIKFITLLTAETFANSELESETKALMNELSTFFPNLLVSFSTAFWAFLI